MIYNNILELQDEFDVFLFDVAGVLSKGGNFYDGTIDVLEELTNNGKFVYIVSNTAKLSADAEVIFAKLGLIKGKHYIEIITAGEACRDAVENDKIDFIKRLNKKSYYTIGKKNKKLFENSNCISVDNIEEANFIYLSAAEITEEEYNNMSDKIKSHVVKLKRPGNEVALRSISLLPWQKTIDFISNTKLPVLNCNPDKTALEETIDGKVVSVVIQGSITQKLRENGIDVAEFGKPYDNIYNLVLSKIDKNNGNIDKNRICMIGDNLATDVIGANNTGIKSVLCLETGVTSYKLKEGKILDDLIKQENVVVDYLIKRVANY